ncbi:MAG: NAD(P)/FAD-dependent oxidoreductase [Sneathiella sp.]
MAQIFKSVDDLEQAIARDFAYINYPPDNWVKPVTGASGQAVLDVAVIGGGACGLAASFGLIQEGIRNIRIFDGNPEGQEGPWVTTARMKTLRSPKHLTGPHMGFPHLTFRAWFEAAYGTDAWEGLDKIPREMWMAYLIWYRKVLALPVENEKTLVSIDPKPDYFELTFDIPGEKETVFARHVVLATGRAASGGVYIPKIAESLPAERFAHTEDDFDYSRLKDQKVLVIGGAASAADSAATALEAGAAEVHMLMRAERMPQLNKFKSISYPGFLRGFSSLPPADRWQFLKHGFDARVAAPRSSMLRLKAFDNFHLHLGSPVDRFSLSVNEVQAHVPSGDISGDFVIFGTGYAMDLEAQPELAVFAKSCLLWRDVFVPDGAMEDRTLEQYPYLGDGFEFLEKQEGQAPFLSRLHLFNAATTMTHAPISSDIPGVNTGAARLVDHISKALFVAGAAAHFADFHAYAEPELLGDEWREK